MSVPQNLFSSHKTDDSLQTYNSLLHEADTYISFFKKRCEIEDEFQSQLFKLALRQVDLDRKLNGELHDLGSTSAHLAWQEITTSVLQEAQLRKNWVRKIRENVIDPLEKFRSSKDRTLNRIRDDLRNSINDHKEYLATVNRLKKQYDRKCEEVNQYHSMVEAVEFRDKLIEERQTDWEHVSNGTSTTNDSQSPPLMTARRSTDGANHYQPGSGTQPGANSTSSASRPSFIISGATSIALRDTAIPVPANPLQAKGNDVLHALRNNTNNLIQRLNSRKDNKTTNGGNTNSGPDDGTIRPSALRGVKLKREAEDADRDYRKGVFHLETLRLRKEQVIRGARRATEDMIFEASGEAKDTFAYYIDETRMAAVSRISICDHAQYLIDKISPEEDAHVYSTTQHEEFSEPKVLYENAFTGPCQSLLFGVAINDYYASHPGKGWVPLLVRICIDEIEHRGIKLEGIYRVSGKMQNVTQLVHEIEKDEDAFRFEPERHDPYTIAGVLKLYLRQLPTPLFTFPLQERVNFSKNLEEHMQNGFSMLSKKIRKLPPAHQATLKLVCEHLYRVSQHSDENKMTSSNLGLVFAPAIFSEETGTQLPPQAWKDSVMEVLIDHHEHLFEGIPFAESAGPSGIRSQRASFVTQPPSPSTRMSLEAEQYESYSRAVSPNRPTEPNHQFLPAASHFVDGYTENSLRIGNSSSLVDEVEHIENKSTSAMNSLGLQAFQSPRISPGNPLSPSSHLSHLQRHTSCKTPKRTFSLRKKRSPVEQSCHSSGMAAPAPSRQSLDSYHSSGLERVSTEPIRYTQPNHPREAEDIPKVCTDRTMKEVSTERICPSDLLHQASPTPSSWVSVSHDPISQVQIPSGVPEDLLIDSVGIPSTSGDGAGGGGTSRGSEEFNRLKSLRRSTKVLGTVQVEKIMNEFEVSDPSNQREMEGAIEELSGETINPPDP
ncbi:hypothetical protein DFH28DRAFT_931730 [Melampsora americana]|nr:hypothetical protein DFH28DRAFT_931730 [Melampsora americana]